MLPPRAERDTHEDTQVVALAPHQGAPPLWRGVAITGMMRASIAAIPHHARVIE
jgi:hypothetical protein